MERERKRSLVCSLADVVFAHAEDLTQLDQAIGDGDHGLNLKRGFEAVMAGLEPELDKSFPDLVKYIGTTLVMKVGGASGALYGTLFMTFGKLMPVDGGWDDFVHTCRQSVEAVQKRGKSEAGQKTMLDVLIPLLEELERGPDEICARVRHRAEAQALATIPLLAVRGRASFLGERSIGHMDPGARSSALMAERICTVWECGQ